MYVLRTLILRIVTANLMWLEGAMRLEGADSGCDTVVVVVCILLLLHRPRNKAMRVECPGVRDEYK